ncbi:LCP family protein [Naumannella halotolerans]|uniref:LCP family protein required for cell wall assembly n=1 Tax=Naumannella halotolerans TaxID=993414 RepID=A0A4V3ENL2_9ACTN|nr:LCP family protein [Naumannella halotolerans]TDT34108.1 LCP family protein required for cell wall assembly [Naumannella halotolerans]
MLLVAWLAFLIGTPLYAWTQTIRIEAMPDGERPADQPGTLWVLIGSDSRDDLSEEEKAELSTGDSEGQRTDTIMLLYRPTFGDPALISVPRDSWVEIPGHGNNKINAAFAIGGAPLLVETIEHNTGLRVDHFGEIGFSGFAGMVDAVGGIEICPEDAIEDPKAGLDIEAGCQEADGATALGYVRTRYEDPTGDLGRTARQREVLGKIARKVVSPLTLINPLRWWGVNMAAAGSFGVDEDAGPFGIGLLGAALLGTTGDGLTLIVPISDPDYRTSGGASAVLWDDEQAQVMFEAIADGDTAELEQFKE